MRLARHSALPLVAALLLLLSTGCGISTNGAAEGAALRGQAVDGGGTAGGAPDGHRGSEVDVDGDTGGPVGELAAQRLERAGSGVAVNLGSSGAGLAFQGLCEGRLDVVVSATPMPARTARLCSINGVRPVTIVAAAEAVVVATRNERDVGVDCLTMPELRAVFGAEIALPSWHRVHGFRLPLRLTGPAPGGPGRELFETVVFGVPSKSGAWAPSYLPRASERGIREDVVGSAATRANAAYLSRARRDLVELRAAIVRKRAAFAKARRELVRGRLAGWSAAAQEDAARAYRKLSRQHADLLRSVPPARAFLRRSRRAAADLRHRIGWAGIFRFSYYERFEQQLRPLELSPGGEAPLDCVFPAAESIAEGQYPLASRTLLVVSAEALRRAAVRRFLNGYLSEAQRHAGEGDTVLLPEAQVARERARIARTGRGKTGDEESGQGR